MWRGGRCSCIEETKDEKETEDLRNVLRRSNSPGCCSNYMMCMVTCSQNHAGKSLSTGSSTDQTEHILRINRALQLAQLVQSSPKALNHLVSQCSKASIAPLHYLLGGLDLVSEATNPSASAIHLCGFIITSFDKELHVWHIC